MQIKGKIVIVTGAARGIGRGIAKAFSREGAKVVLADLGSLAGDWDYALAAESELARAADEIRAGGGACQAMEVDVAERASCQRLVERTVAAFGGLDILVNNAGVIQTGPLVDFPEEHWDRVLAVNVKGIFLMSQAALPHLKQNGGSIINIASVAGKQGFANMGAYCASKFAVIGLTESMAAELADCSIRVNAICPGNVNTAMWFDHLSKSESRQSRYDADNVDDTFEAVIDELVPLGRAQSPGDMADAALYLARSAGVTGYSLAVAGGVAMH